MGTPGDKTVGLLVEEELRKRGEVPENLVGKTNLNQFIHAIAHASFILCNDSGSMHLAAAFRTLGIAVFGSTEPRLTGPISSSVKALRHQVPCSPCFLRECPLDSRCMNAISVDNVLNASESLINRRSIADN